MKPLQRPGLLRPAWALAILGLSLLSTIGAYGLLEPTETRYAEIAREMRASGDWLRPHLDGLSHFHKPPLAYWASAAGMSLLGENAAGARLGVVMVALALLAMTALAARRALPSLAIEPASAVWLLGTMLLFTALGRSLAADPFLAAAVAGFWAFAPSPWAIAALGVGFLAKGPVVFVHTVLPVLLVALWRRDRGVLARLGPRSGWLLFAAVALPWYVLMAARTPGLLSYLLGDQLWGRYATTVHERGGPPWYFVGVLVAGALPWTFALGAGIARAWRERANAENQLLLAWLIAPVAFLSFSGSKLPAYLLPCFPAAALLAARGLDSLWARRLTAGLLLALVLGGFAAGPQVLGRWLGNEPRLPDRVGLPAAVAGVAGAIAAAWALRGRPERAGLQLTLAYTALIVAVAPFEGTLGSPRPIARLLIENRTPGEPVVEIKRFNAGLPFYLGEIVPLFQVEREPGFDDPARVRRVMITADSLAAWSERHPRIWTLGPARRCEEIADSLGLRYTAIARWRKDALGHFAR